MPFSSTSRLGWRHRHGLCPQPSLIFSLATLAWQCRSEQWLRDDGAYVPYAGTYLRGERWTDEPPKKLQPKPAHWSEECARLHGSTCPHISWHLAKRDHEKTA